MMYPFLTLDDGTEIVHSETKPDGRVKVYIEKPDAKDCFHHATCWLPRYEWEDVSGFSPSEMIRLKGIVRSIERHVLANIERIIEARVDEVLAKWDAHFGQRRYYC